MKKTIILAVVCVLLVFSLAGCKSEKEQSFTYNANDVTGIEIETGGASVSIVRNSGSNIEVSYTQDVAAIQNGVLKINIPIPDNGVNIKKQPDITISVPNKVFDVIQIKSEVGNVKIEDVNTEKLVVDAQYGDITLSGLEGYVTAKADMGSVKTALPIASEIKSLGTVGQELDGQIGTAENEINLYTNTGTIELK